MDTFKQIGEFALWLLVGRVGPGDDRGSAFAVLGEALWRNEKR